jgi:hypothetical protein
MGRNHSSPTGLVATAILHQYSRETLLNPGTMTEDIMYPPSSFLHTPCSPIAFIPSQHPYPAFFTSFGTIDGYPLLLMALPTIIHHIGLFFHTIHLVLEPSHSFAPACPPTHFCFLIHSWIFFCVHFNYDPFKYVIASIE